MQDSPCCTCMYCEYDEWYDDDSEKYIGYAYCVYGEGKELSDDDYLIGCDECPYEEDSEWDDENE